MIRTMETIALTLHRFQELAEAYGGDIARWPLAERDGAAKLRLAEPAATAPILAAAETLDAWLYASPNPTPSLALGAAIIAAAPRSRRPALGRRWAGIGLSAGLAAASVAGVLIGAVAAPIATAHVQTADSANEAARWLGEPNDMAEG